MAKVGLFAETEWVSAPAPDDAEAFLGALVGNPFILGIALLFIGAALLLSRAGAAPSLSEQAASGSAQLHLAAFPMPSRETGLRIQSADPKLEQRSTEHKGQSGKGVRDQGGMAHFSVYGRSGRPFDLRFLRMKSNASLERGPPISETANHLAGSDRTSWHTRSRTDREVRHRAGRDIWGRIR